MTGFLVGRMHGRTRPWARAPIALTGAAGQQKRHSEDYRGAQTHHLASLLFREALDGVPAAIACRLGAFAPMFTTIPMMR